MKRHEGTWKQEVSVGQDRLVIGVPKRQEHKSFSWDISGVTRMSLPAKN